MSYITALLNKPANNSLEACDQFGNKNVYILLLLLLFYVTAYFTHVDKFSFRPFPQVCTHCVLNNQLSYESTPTHFACSSIHVAFKWLTKLTRTRPWVRKTKTTSPIYRSLQHIAQSKVDIFWIREKCCALTFFGLCFAISNYICR